MKLALSLMPLLALVVLSLAFQQAVLSRPEELRRWLESYGPAAVLLYAAIQVTTIVIAPIGGYAPQIAVYGLFGPVWGPVLVYAVVSPTYVLNFYLARRYGSRVIRKLAGPKTDELIGRYLNYLDTPLLILLRMQPSMFDYAAYAAGLSRIGVKRFLMIDLLAGLVTVPLTYLVFRYSPSFATAVAFHLTLLSVATLLVLRKFRGRANAESGNPHP